MIRIAFDGCGVCKKCVTLLPKIKQHRAQEGSKMNEPFLAEALKWRDERYFRFHNTPYAAGCFISTEYRNMMKMCILNVTNTVSRWKRKKKAGGKSYWWFFGGFVHEMFPLLPEVAPAELNTHTDTHIHTQTRRDGKVRKRKRKQAFSHIRLSCCLFTIAWHDYQTVAVVSSMYSPVEWCCWAWMSEDGAAVQWVRWVKYPPGALTWIRTSSRRCSVFQW